MAAAIVQVYKTIADYQASAYPHFSMTEDRKVFPTVVTLENWRMFGPVMMDKLGEAVTQRLSDESLRPELLQEMPYSVWGIEELEVGLQIMHSNGIIAFMEGKLNDPDKRRWDWHGYMTDQYRTLFPAKRLFDKEYDEMFADLFATQDA